MSALPKERVPDKLALLVGSNPLPNYLAAIVLQPGEVILLYSPETREPCERLEAAFEERQIAVSNVAIDDATDARKIHDACASLQVDHLHYSGGTKPMAAHARKACKVGEAQASYLDERRGLLRFDDGYDLGLEQRDLGLTLERVLKLHGIERVGPSTPVSGAPTAGDVATLAQRILCESEVASKLFEFFRPEGKRRSFTQAKSAPWMPNDYNLSLSVTRVPDDEWTKARYEEWDEFLTGGWLERWTASLIRASLGEAASDIEVGVQCKRARPSLTEFEIDVALIRGHRLHVISCTTDQTKALCKSKLFEVSMRARQMGGDLARSALVCLLDGSDAKGSYVDQLRADMASLWDAPNVPRAFGLAHLREWAGIAGAPNFGSMKEWLDS